MREQEKKERLKEIRLGREISSNSECLESTSKTQATRELEKIFGKPEKGFEFCHHCDNSLCYNKDHIFIGTRSDNMLDCHDKGRLSFPYVNIGRNEENETKLAKVIASTDLWKNEEYREKVIFRVSNLTKQNVIDIRKNTEKSIYDWSKELGVNPQVVYRAKKGVTFKSIGGLND